MEELDICDEQGNPTGHIITRNEAHEKGILHRTVHIWVMRKTDDKIQLLLQKRSMKKDSYPGKLDTSAAGHIQAGDEPLPSAIRELYEELGIQAKEEDLKFVDRLHIHYEKEFHGKSFKDNEIIFMYVYDKEISPKDIVIQKEELESVEWMDAEYVYNACINHDSHFCIPEKNIRTLMKYLKKPGDEMRYYQKGEFQGQKEGIKNPEELFALFLRCWCAETCTPRMRKHWNQDNPTLGQCAVTAFVVQDLLGGEVYGIPLKDGGVHCFNVVDQCVFDLTCEQFEDEKLDYDHSKIQSRQVHFQRQEKKQRYELLREKALQKLHF